MNSSPMGPALLLQRMEETGQQRVRVERRPTINKDVER